MKQLMIIFYLSAIAPVFATAQPFIAEGRQPLAVLPAQTAGVSKSVISLDGEWEINMNPEGEVWKTQQGNWKKIQVPGEPAMQGFKVENEKEFFYRTTINLPSESKNKNLLIRFNGVYSYARVYVNGKFLRDHHGGFTAWEVDITDVVKPGEKATVYVGVTDRLDDISYASGYAHHPIGGILRKVQLLVLPKEYINRLYINTTLADNNKRADLSFNIAGNSTAGSKVKVQLFDEAGKLVSGSDKTVAFEEKGETQCKLSIANPTLWNQEAPYLYTVKVQLVKQNKVTETIEKRFGVREVKVLGNQVFVNGDAIKLRGGCRHDMHPLLGRSTNRYYDSLDIVLAKEANLNFIRTSHYPPTDDFLEFADRFGMYVQEETAICFVLDWREAPYFKVGETQNDTAFTARYLGQLSEMIDRDRNHAAVIMWSIGNESHYGLNFQKEYEFVKSVDRSRPVSWSFPTTALDKQQKCFDILVSHYPAYNGSASDLGKYEKGMVNPEYPILGDEWAHIACYNVTTLKNDPNVKDFWGRSMDSTWHYRFDVKGNLGGAIWGMIDETFHLPDTVTGYGPWGFVDVWRRKKTEFWNTRKAYSPVKVLTTSFPNTATNTPISITVKNRFNHLRLDKIRLEVTQAGNTVNYVLPPLKPHEEGQIQLKTSFSQGDLLLRFYDDKKNLIDEELISRSLNQPEIPLTQTNDSWKITQADSVLTLTGNNKEIILHKTTGQLIAASAGGQKIINGPLRFTVFTPNKPNVLKESNGFFTGAFVVHKATIDQSVAGKIIVRAEGKVDKHTVAVTSIYSADGNIETSYTADSIPGKTWQIGMAVPITHAVNNFDWQRKGYWTTYPKDHLSAQKGSAERYPPISGQYRVKPDYPVSQDLYDYYLTGSVTAEKAKMPAADNYRAAKENIFSMTLKAETKPVLQVLSNGKQAGKLSILPNGEQELLVLDKLDYWVLSWGNYQGTINTSNTVSGTIHIRLL